MIRRLACILVSGIMLSCLTGIKAQSRIVQDFKPVCDSLQTLLQEKTTVKVRLELKAVMKRGSYIDLYFTRTLGDYPWHNDTYRWFKDTVRDLFPDSYRRYRLGEIYCSRTRLEQYLTNRPGNSGEPSDFAYRVKDFRNASAPLVKETGVQEFGEGLSGRHIALWQSHGRYYEQSTRRWEWQRACLFQTVEDMFTPGFVLPYLVPMLENAGCCVLMPRERDPQPYETITDNDPHFSVPDGMESQVRRFGSYSEKGRWSDAGTGFADTSMVYISNENPFKAGTARKAEYIQSGRESSRISEARWQLDIPQRGEYAVYVSYVTIPGSTDAAHYSVHHMGGTTHFSVNQQMGGGTWIYLGTFTFDKGDSGYVLLDNIAPKGTRAGSGRFVTADAVKVGGGMGNIARRVWKDSAASPELSGMPRYAEGARYWMQWAGISEAVYSQKEQENDYMDDFMSRGMWVQELSGGSRVNRNHEGKNIPIDMAFAFHSDAGTSPGDSIIGTLGIYTLECEHSRKFPDKSDRMTSRELTDFIQTQVVEDLRNGFDPDWSRRETWDRSYSESRTTGVPTMLLELMSHQNFSDMRHGLDPSFRFTVSRSVYKGILKYLSNRYGCSYAVQPLPVHSFAARFRQGRGQKGGIRAELSWKETEDTLEPTAAAESYILYTRIDDGAFDRGKKIENIKYSRGRISAEVSISPGHIYSFRIAACNSGGISFPSETLSIGIPEGRTGAVPDSSVIVVNNFDRVSCPAWFDTPQYAGFDNRLDSGVPYVRDISYIGEMYQFRRDLPWTDDDNAGFGASYTDYAGKPVAGNTFDYPSVHGRAIMAAGYPFFSASADAFVADSTLRSHAWCADLICGKQVTTMIGRGSVPDRYQVFPAGMRDALSSFASSGRDILISGSNIGTDIWDRVFPVERDSADRAASIAFAEKVLGYRWVSNYASRTAEVMPAPSSLSGFPVTAAGKTLTFANRPNPEIYSVETPDGIAPSDVKARSILKYRDSGISAGICYDSGSYRTVCIGFPLETIGQEDIFKALISDSLKYFNL